MVTDLGALVGTYPTNYRRRMTGAVVLLLAGVVLTPLATVLLVATDERAGKVATTGDPLLLPIVLLAFGAGLLLMGVAIGVWALRSRGEVFRLHEHGLVHDRTGTSRTIRWTDLDDVVVNQGRDNALARWAGGDVSCVLKVRGGANATITGLTENAGELVARVRRTQE
ncbi:hypothetical protein [Actinophytocola gossypii]|uniref:PH domain-containing protein n=1 Tax=Actinophytocola gossypii TaxID=2812003 RepID=A0ABT2JHS8_9PSEU|nr:hypothetical protein [Actinophytocola gossypii]MCT2587298.1 hypothetical protein [Actinophytocola gossypii]